MNVHFAIQYLIDLFTGLFEFFDRIFIDTGYIVWVGSAFLMVITYRFLVLPIFGSFSISNLSDSAKRYRKVQESRSRNNSSSRDEE